MKKIVYRKKDDFLRDLCYIISKMSYDTLEKQIRALPLEAQEEIAHYVGYLFSLYNSVNQKNAISEKINTFMKNNPTAFNEFSDIQNTGLESIRELTKNDTW